MWRGTHLAKRIRVYVHRAEVLEVGERRRPEREWARRIRRYAAQRKVPYLGLRLEKRGQIRIEPVFRATPTPPFSVRHTHGETHLMDVANDRRRNGPSLGNIHARARCRFSCTDTSTLSAHRRGSMPRTLAMSNSSANSTLLSAKFTASALTSSRRAAGARASDSRRRTVRCAGRSPMLW